MTPDAAARLSRARCRIAHALLGDGHDAPMVMGDVALRAHQRDAVRRLRVALSTLGGALLADEAGLGKTYVALALAREARAPLVVLPAALRATWRQAMQAAGVHAPLVTHEALSRAPGAPRQAHDLVIVDEAHHARNPATRRWRALAALTRGARVLLLSATPIHNRPADLAALLALFLGVRARDASDALLARCIVRRARDDAMARDAAALPTVAPVAVLALSHDDDVLDALAALPPVLGDGDDAGADALLAHALVRQWASSEGALRGALMRRLARAAGLEAALREGCRPDRAELARWTVADDAVQLPFASLLAPAEPDAERLLAAVTRHADAVRLVLARLAAGIGRDVERAARLLQLRARHQGERIVAFTSYAGTVRALWRLLRGEPGVAALTSHGGAVAGGAVSREDVLHRFAPRAHAVAAPRPSEAVTLLVTTDLASEGVNLQDASVVVHLDLPWTPARLEQRVGRVARLGAARDVVHVYAMAPPAAAERVLAVEARLRAKLAAAARAVGVSGAIVPPIALHDGIAAPAPADDSAPRLAERTRATLARWRDQSRAPHDDLPDDSAPPVAAVRAATTGALALVRDDRGARLVALDAPHRRGASADPGAVARMVAAVDAGGPVAAPPALVRAARRRIAAWAASDRARIEDLLHRAFGAMDAATAASAAPEARGPDDRLADRPAPFALLALVLLVPAPR